MGLDAEGRFTDKGICADWYVGSRERQLLFAREMGCRRLPIDIARDLNAITRRRKRKKTRRDEP